MSKTGIYKKEKKVRQSKKRKEGEEEEEEERNGHPARVEREREEGVRIDSRLNLYVRPKGEWN